MTNSHTSGLGRKPGWAGDWRRHFFYWMLPSLIVLIYIGMYFSGHSLLRDLIAPSMNREFGLLENTQVLIIIGAGFVAMVGIRRAVSGIQRLVFLIAALGCLFLFLEEIDYGLHIWEKLSGVQNQEIDTPRNLHNIGDNTDRIKRVTDSVMLLGFVILPFLGKWLPAKLRYFVPERHSALTAVCAVSLSRFAHVLADGGFYVGGPISKNISEFREVFTYYMWFMLFVEMVYVRHWPFRGSSTKQSV